METWNEKIYGGRDLKSIKIFWKELKVDLQSQMAYRTNFFFNTIGMVLFSLIVPFTVFVIYGISSGIPGWTYGEFVFFYGTNILVWGISRFLFELMIYTTEWRVRSGHFDFSLLKPIKTEKYLSISNPNIEGIPMIVSGLLFILWSLPSVSFTLMSFLIYITLCFCGLVVLYSISIMLSAAAIRFVKIAPLLAFYWTISDFTDYPLDIFNAEIKNLFTFILPLGIVSFYPSSFFLGRINDYILIIWLIITTLLFFFASRLIFNRAIKRYTSAGG